MKAPHFQNSLGQPDREPVPVKGRWLPEHCSLEGHLGAWMPSERSVGLLKQYQPLQFEPRRDPPDF
jgi:hypothetical protein